MKPKQLQIKRHKIKKKTSNPSPAGFPYCTRILVHEPGKVPFSKKGTFPGPVEGPGMYRMMILLRDFSDRLKPPSTLLRWAFPTKPTTIVTATEISDCPRKGVLGSRLQISTRPGPVIPHGHHSQAGGFMTKIYQNGPSASSDEHG